MVVRAIESVFSLLILVVLGYYAAGKSWFGTVGSDFLSKFTVKIAIPIYMLYNVVNTCKDRLQLIEIFKALPVPLLTMLVSLMFGILLAQVCRIPVGRRGVFINAVTFSNTVIIGFPVVEALYGGAGAPDAMVYYMANTILFWTVGVFLLKRDSDIGARLLSRSGIRSILSPPMLGFFAGVIIVWLGVELPYFIWSPITMLKQTTTPLCMLFIGSVIRDGELKSLRLNKDITLVLVVRFLITPMFVLSVCRLLPLSEMSRQVFFVLATMPAMTQLGIMSKETGSDYPFASVLITITTAISLLSIPVYVFILGI